MTGPSARRARRTRTAALRPLPRGLPVLLAAFLLAAAGLDDARLDAQVIDPSYVIHLTPQIEGPNGSVRTVGCFLDIEASGSPLAAWSLGICHDAAVVMPIAAVPGAPLATLKGGAPADFIVVEFDPLIGVEHGLVICFTSCSPLLPPVADLTLLTADYSLGGAPGSTTELATCNTVAVGGNPVPTIVVTQSAGSRIPLQEPCAVTISDPQLRRGDCSPDGSVTISDAIFYLSTLFGPAQPLACADACDSNDDGQLDIADAVRTLTYLFAGGVALPPPFPGCGTDPSSDAIECEVPTPGC